MTLHARLHDIADRLEAAIEAAREQARAEVIDLVYPNWPESEPAPIEQATSEEQGEKAHLPGGLATIPMSPGAAAGVIPPEAPEPPVGAAAAPTSGRVPEAAPGYRAQAATRGRPAPPFDPLTLATCPECGHQAKNAAGLSIHRGRAHGQKPLIVEGDPSEPNGHDFKAAPTHEGRRVA